MRSITLRSVLCALYATMSIPMRATGRILATRNGGCEHG
jgi:hypothetical protein